MNASPEDVWTLLTDWAGFDKWWVKPADGGRPGPDLARVELVDPADQIPRTRIIHHVTGSSAAETLLVQDDETRRIYYNMIPRASAEGVVLRSEYRNYLATTLVDGLPDGTTLMTFKSEFDLVEGADMQLMQSIIERTYTDALLLGFRRYFARRANA